MDIVDKIITVIVNPLLTLLFSLAGLYFLYGVFKFIQNAENSEKRLEGARHMLWGIIGIAIMFSVFAFIHVIRQTVGPSPYNETPSLK